MNFSCRPTRKAEFPTEIQQLYNRDAIYRPLGGRKSHPRLATPIATGTTIMSTVATVIGTPRTTNSINPKMSVIPRTTAAPLTQPRQPVTIMIMPLTAAPAWVQ